MSTRSPLSNLVPRLRGGSYLWDTPAGVVAAKTIFEADEVPPGPAALKYWNGAGWLSKPLKYWNGTAWTQKTLKRWNGSAWITE